MGRPTSAAIGVLAVAGTLFFTGRALGDGATAPAGASPGVRAGRVMHLDPATGRPTRPPVRPDPRFLAAQRSRLNHSDAGLAEQAGPHGGVMVDLRGRFRSLVVAEIGRDGTLETGCGEDAP